MHTYIWPVNGLSFREKDGTVANADDLIGASLNVTVEQLFLADFARQPVAFVAFDPAPVGASGHRVDPGATRLLLFGGTRG